MKMGFVEVVLARVVGGYESHPPFIPPHLGTSIPNEGGNGRYFQWRAGTNWRERRDTIVG
jgi:hypothetical protein